MTLLALENVTKSYGATAALDNISLEISAGKIVGSLGPNGSGKTTPIKLINGPFNQIKDVFLLMDRIQVLYQGDRLLPTRYNLPQ